MKQTYTIAELCARLGLYDYEDGYHYAEIHKSFDEVLRLVLKRNKTIKGGSIILSINDKLPSDECETCGKSRFTHISERWCWLNMPNEFKPLLRTVKSIKLVEIKMSKAFLSEMKKRGTLAKPVQMVEIEVGK